MRSVVSGGRGGTPNPVPGVVKRNTLLVAGAQMCVGAGLGVVPTLGALMVIQLLGSPAYAGLALATLGLSRFVVAYPVGLLADVFGRRAALQAALAVGLAGTLLSGLSMMAGWFPGFIVSVFIFGLGVGAGMQLRVAAADMYLPERRAEGLGFVTTGSVVGAALGTALIAAADVIGRWVGWDPLALVWWLIPSVLVPGLLVVHRINPDPKFIAAHLRLFYPGAVVDEPSGSSTPGSGKALWFLNDGRKRAAFMAAFAAQGGMSIVMAVTAVELVHQGHGLTSVGFASAVHALGMFGFGIPQGRVADRLGRPAVMAAGLALAALGTLLTAGPGHYWSVTAGFFLVGFGWSCVTVAGTALLADLSTPDERGRVVGVNDAFAGAGNVLLALSAGPLVAWLGMTAAGVAGALLMIPPLVMVLRLPGGPVAPVREPA